jgi:hypothetical protein
MNDGKHGGSFRDPNGFIFLKGGILYRQVNVRCRDAFDALMESGLYDDLVTAELLVGHEEVSLSLALSADAYKVIRPNLIPFVSYPHEWSFSQLKAAALTTLEIQKRALEHGMSLKDCSAFNVQFVGGKPVFIDTLSFERYREGEPWVAYHQFCRHFLAPLALMSNTDVRLSQLLRVYIDGMPLDLASSLLPLRTRLKLPLLTHIHMHARFQRRYEGRSEKPLRRGKVSRTALLGIVDSLENAVDSLKFVPAGTEWGEYYEDTNYTDNGLRCKERLVEEFLRGIEPGMVWDLGANTGRFSRIAAAQGHYVVSFDVDPEAVEKNYLSCVDDGRRDILPLLLDLANPTCGMGWAGTERMSLPERGPAGTVLMLALIHHLAISNNLPFDRIAEFLNTVCRALIVEFVPKDDSQVRRLLVCREDIFDEFTQKRFEEAFGRFFRIVRAEKIVDSLRTLYLMQKEG